MIDDEAPLFGPGHNNPPSQIEAAIAEQRQSLEAYRVRRDDFVRAADAAVVRDRDTAGQAADIKHLAAAVWKDIDDARRKRSDPFYEAQTTLKAIADDFWQPVFDALKALGAKVQAWDDAEKARIQQQQDEQNAEMRRLRDQAAPAGAVRSATPAPTAPAREPRRRRTRGDYGGTVVEKTTHQFEVIDVRAIPDFILNAAPVHAAIISVVRGMAKVTDVPGIKKISGSEIELR
ncbi:hypothetical protein [Sphingomonas koreensis]|jgi:hypothetical protein|uniref:hypothetical protein n=1 Tax=Sphingomonas koreensis TaxID=93064 RepID=UPI00234EDFF0|nr:hypothetical protein [Sphingomonas koreensis]MDC7810531.1 hypothetical protein [Sphingomonas koreensis]